MLTALHPGHGDALEGFLRAFDPQPDELHGYFCERDWPIDRAVAALEGWARGEQLREGWVPCTTWFWETDGALQGVINLRHRLTPALRRIGGHIGYSVAPGHRRQGVATRMLGAVLEVCRERGLERVLLTADADNPASWRTIERNGGELEREERLDHAGSLQRWYWIDLAGTS